MNLTNALLIGALGLCAVLAGCMHKGYQREHAFKGLHIFGIGWIMERTGTNKVRAFGIGLVDAGHYVLTTNTNAPYSFNRPATNAVPEQ
jgi:hypothetical protein